MTAASAQPGLPFENRAEAGRQLAAHLQAIDRFDHAAVLGLARGGVPVAYEIAMALHAPLDVFLVRKLGAPSQPELAMGAITSGGVVIRNRPVVFETGVTDDVFRGVQRDALVELERQERAYRGERPSLELADQVTILVDDGLATGTSMQAAIAAVRRCRARRVVVAVPVAPASTCDELMASADEVICLSTPRGFRSVGHCYRDFSQVGDHEVRELLARAEDRSTALATAVHERSPGMDEPPDDRSPK